MSLNSILQEHYSPDIQLSIGQIYAIGSAIRAAAPGGNVLIFGCGNDSGLWDAINFDGHTVFLESDTMWIARTRERSPGLTIAEVSYGERTVEGSLPIDEEALSRYPVPGCMRVRPWDVILIDAPRGYDRSRPGRSLPIYWSSKVSSPETHIFLDDYDRRLEKAYGDHYFRSRRAWSVVIPRIVDAGKPTDSSLLWVFGVETASPATSTEHSRSNATAPMSYGHPSAFDDEARGLAPGDQQRRSGQLGDAGRLASQQRRELTRRGRQAVQV